MDSTARSQQPEPFAIVGGRVVLPYTEVTGSAVIVQGSKIADLCPEETLGVGIRTFDVSGRYVVPGLIDIHVHGALGFTFNEPSFRSFDTITRNMAMNGVTSVLATIATAPIEDIIECLRFAREWGCTSHGGAQVLGVHVEGPYFNPAQRGSQDLSHLRIPSDESWHAFLEYTDIIRIMSYAPELAGSQELTTWLARAEIVPAAGHSSGTDADIISAMDMGLRHITHIWNAQSTVVREGLWRKPGVVEAALASDTLTVEMICDNKHLPTTLMKLAYKCVGRDRLCIISDATSGAGLAEGSRFKMGGLEYEVSCGVGVTLDRTSFAGSTTLLNQMISVLKDSVGIPLVDIICMASLTPARVIGMAAKKGSLETGKDADIAILEDDFTCWRTLIAGQWVT